MPWGSQASAVQPRLVRLKRDEHAEFGVERLSLNEAAVHWRSRDISVGARKGNSPPRFNPGSRQRGASTRSEPSIADCLADIDAPKAFPGAYSPRSRRHGWRTSRHCNDRLPRSHLARVSPRRGCRHCRDMQQLRLATFRLDHDGALAGKAGMENPAFRTFRITHAPPVVESAVTSTAAGPLEHPFDVVVRAWPFTHRRIARLEADEAGNGSFVTEPVASCSAARGPQIVLMAKQDARNRTRQKTHTLTRNTLRSPAGSDSRNHPPSG